MKNACDQIHIQYVQIHMQVWPQSVQAQKSIAYNGNYCLIKHNYAYTQVVLPYKPQVIYAYYH